MAAPLTVVIFGASGDLTARKLVPALFNLSLKDRLPDGDPGRRASPAVDFTDASFRDHLGQRRGTPSSVRRAVGRGRLGGVRRDRPLRPDRRHRSRAGSSRCAKWFDDDEGPGGGRRLYYLSVAPDLYPELGTTLGEAGFDQGGRRVPPAHHREAVRPRPGDGQGAERRAAQALRARTSSTASTTTSARRRSRTSWCSGSPTRCSSRCGTTSTSTTCRSRWPRR